MLDQPQVVATQAQETAVIRLTIPRDTIQAVMGGAIGELLSVVAAQGIGPTGPLYSYHHRGDPATFDFDVGVPVSRAVEPAGRVQAGVLPAATVVRTVYRGPYEGLGNAWSDFMKQVQAQGHTITEAFWERYVAGPESSPDPAQWATELNRPLKA